MNKAIGIISDKVAIRNSEFNKNVLKVFSGTLLAQGISLIVYPILTRIYSPEDFSSLALYLSLVAILAVFVTGKYENAIILVKEDKEAFNLIVLATYLSLFICGLFLFCFLIFGDFLVNLFQVNAINDWIIFVPISIFARSIYRVLEIWFNRKKEYNKLSGNRTVTAGINGSLKIGFQQVLALNAFGLVFGQTLSLILSTWLFGRDFLKTNWAHLKPSLKDLRQVAKTYITFPLYSLPAAFLSLLTRELPILMLAVYFEPKIVGFYLLTKTVIENPSAMVSHSFLEVFKQKATEDYHQKGNCKIIFISTLKKLLLISIVPFSVLYFIAPPLFPILFGENWVQAGEFAQILILFYFIKFITTPLVFVFYIMNKINIELIIQILIFGVSLGTLSYGGYFFSNPKDTLWLFAIGHTLIYIFYLFYAFKTVWGVKKVA